jgi:Xaa-Pro aminopeptidase
MRKSPAELDALRRAVAVCDAAQLAVTAAADDGRAVDDLRALVDETVCDAVGGAVPALVEVAYGAGCGAESTTRPLRDGDLLLSDVAPRVDGYWGDSCDTRLVGTPRAEAEAAMRTVREALLLGTEAVRPGVAANAVDAVMRGHVGRRYPPYEGTGGHGIGLDYHEAPRLIPSDTTTLQPDMVVTLEPGVYLDDIMIRLEHVVRVVPQGCEVLSSHQAWHGLRAEAIG